ncbi:2-oxoglutarate dehydrogenase, E1 subunit [Acidimicrobium ferrooxidans DSM 10331]|uniref:2-oxoglutarate dehydrogenase, E1 subunit n=1 Tax=Acidimicrobium ferrooxidans (strain DSM 10331 / JCM 15462 / NBRC 103882 / ICP) TaxID=525909 RepID=C7M0Z0_ACIFD|nr:multifunctional oxoglutarate decarboxylase/oxoglutarate dehydrogenase thiamine pyrophosphate-binding subunit/dihydrolipoyllysine-residue succinyltransferase subunit [Acidimicrobium ferrooxidans]ACU54648.1 2-oxoglutarate dehydrogenase, E1 subunit [Acidimicrobium ferrooxidans DSM 10331]
MASAPDNSTVQHSASEQFGPNDWFVEEMAERYRANPLLVPESWRAYFEGERVPDGVATKTIATATAKELVGFEAPGVATPPTTATPAPTSPPHNGATPQTAPFTPASSPEAVDPLTPPRSSAPETAPHASEPAVSTTPTVPSAQPLRGAQGALARNMEASLAVPTATSVRAVPTRALEVNRATINDQLQRLGRSKVSFGHLVAWAIVRALVEHPRMHASYVADADGRGHPGIVIPESVNLGIAVDVQRPDGTRSLLVPVIRNADTLGPLGFFAAYDDAVRAVRSQQASPDLFVGATASITNPGTIGTEHSIPRLMPGQGVIVGVGAIAYPAAFQAADPRLLGELGVSRTITLTSTYDHRIIQGAESGQFLATIAALLEGEQDFYDEIFSALQVPYPPMRWQADHTSMQPDATERLAKQVHVQSLIHHYRVRGHLLATLDPLDLTRPTMSPELDPATYGLTLWDLSRPFLAEGLVPGGQASLETILQVLRDTYCQTIGYEFMHIQSPDEKLWIQQRIEGSHQTLTKDDQLRILATLNDAEAFEKFLSTRYIGQKRFGLEGGESAIVFLREVLDHAAETGTHAAVIGMAHRGRLNVLANIVGKSYRTIFAEFEGNLDPSSVQGSGDVKYHKGFEGHYRTASGSELPVTLASNPSHLEAVDPVVEGMVRALQDQRGTLYEFGVLGILVHGDASFAGQGVVAETLNLSQLPGYRTGGTVHLVINNQVGFTTNPSEARSSFYASDIAKTIQAPIFHVNGDDPEAVARCARLAVEYRATFHKDVVVDLICYRRHGHNEGDEPSYTQPVMYHVIEQHPSVRRLYADQLVRSGAISEDEADQALEAYLQRLATALAETREAAPPKPTELPPEPARDVPLPIVTTAVDKAALDYVIETIHRVPEDFHLHPKLARQFETRRALYEQGQLDWALGELAAYGTLLLEGHDVRLSGQDTRRGTFSHRHAALYDYETGAMVQPLARLRDDEVPVPHASPIGRFMVYDSSLSEYAAMGFEYGYSLVQRSALVIWEAQFGDFANGAQIVIDQFIAGALDKWDQHSGLVLYLPHGYEGQGPEHSSARLERFLALAAGPNLAVVQPSTAAQLFHLVRAQVARTPQRPLVVLTPKSLLRARETRSAIAAFTDGGFQPVLADPLVDDGELEPTSVRRLILASGKVAYEAMAKRAKGELAAPTAIVRVDQLYPWPREALAAALATFPNLAELVWLQEEPENMGAWPSVHELLHRMDLNGARLRHVSRVRAGSPATGSAAMHALEQADLLRRALEAPLP